MTTDSTLEAGPLTGDAQAIIQHVRATSEPRKLEPGRIYLATDEDGDQNIIDTNQWSERPRRYDRSVLVHDTDSLIGYVKTHQQHQDGVEVWVSPGPNGRTPVVTAVLDANGWRNHMVRLLFEATPDWEAWLGISGDQLSQEKFSEFVEDHVDDIVIPSGATMLELAQSIRARSKSNFKSDKRLANGQTQLEYTETIDATAGKAGTIVIPDEITLALQPFQGSKVYKVRAKFRYRISGGNLSLGVKLLNPERVVQAVLDDVVDDLHEGLPEALIALGRI